MNYKTEIKISGEYFTIFLVSDKNKELARLLFTKYERSVRIDDLITPKRRWGYGTILVNEFIKHCHNNFHPSIIVYGYVRHEEIFSSNLGVNIVEALFFRKIRNRFWQNFGFTILEEIDYHDNMIANLSDLRQKL